MQLQPAVLVHITQSGEAIDDVTQPFRPLESLIPAVGLVAIHVLEQLLGLAAQRLLELARTGPRDRQIPLRGKSAVHQTQIQGGILGEQRALQEPLEQRIAVRGLQDRRQGVVGF